jgi:hypothetical protein
VKAPLGVILKIVPWPLAPPAHVTPYMYPLVACTIPACGLAPSEPSKLCRTVKVGVSANEQLATAPSINSAPAVAMPKFGFVITGANAIVPRNSPGPKGFWMIFCWGNLENPVPQKKRARTRWEVLVWA